MSLSPMLWRQQYDRSNAGKRKIARPTCRGRDYLRSGFLIDRKSGNDIEARLSRAGLPVKGPFRPVGFISPRPKLHFPPLCYTVEEANSALKAIPTGIAAQGGPVSQRNQKKFIRVKGRWCSVQVKIARRAEGKSAIAAAAYRLGIKLTDPRTGVTHDFRNKKGITGGGICLPPGAPDHLKTVEGLWNSVELAERRQDAQPYRDVTIALPAELSDDQRAAMVEQLSQKLANDYGIAVMYALHDPSEDGDNRNYHAHLMLSTKKVDDSKKYGFGNKCRELDPIAQSKRGGAEKVTDIRKLVAEELNSALEMAGFDERVDHRSYAARGIDLIPTKHVGRIRTQVERRGVKLEIPHGNDDIRAANKEIEQLQLQIMGAEAEIERMNSSVRGEIRPAPRPRFDKQAYKLGLLEKAYRTEFDKSLAQDLKYVFTQDDMSQVETFDGDSIVDTGPKITFNGKITPELAKLMLAQAVAKGWWIIEVDGGDEFKQAIWRAAMEARVTVSNYIPTGEEYIDWQEIVQPEPFDKETIADRREDCVDEDEVRSNGFEPMNDLEPDEELDGYQKEIFRL